MGDGVPVVAHKLLCGYGVGSLQHELQEDDQLTVGAVTPEHLSDQQQ